LGRGIHIEISGNLEQLATPDDFWGALTGDEYAATLGTRQRYLRDANVLARPADLP